ncbi:MAG TPA: nitroreductase family protein [Spirochaetota bacterium]|nr:nitroreductase family protein [Spirochaetota bacterium]HPI87766.1 nitroreductase family protein [Spirochaetota bacterium]HPR47058.1 nitroreductase family protein [Spirochaetota bacterium]
MFENIIQAYLPEIGFPTRVVDKDKCTGCKRCYESCPTGGFKWGDDNKPEPIGYGGLEQACLNCWNCLAVCPSGAISVSGPLKIKRGRYRSLLKGEMKYPDPLNQKSEQSYEKAEARLTPVEKAIYRRRSNRLFRDKAVSDELLHRVIEAGRFAPSAGNCQPYKFLVITDMTLIREFEKKSMKLLRLTKNLYLDKKGKRRFWKNVLFTLWSLTMINKVDPRPITAMEKGDNCDDRLYFNAPAMIMVLKDARGISNPDLDAGICCQNMVLAAHSLGLGSCYISLPITPLTMPLMAGFRKKLGIRYPWVPVTTIALGWPKGKIDNIVKRDTPQIEWYRAN